MDFGTAEITDPTYLQEPPALVELYGLRGSVVEDEADEESGLRYAAIRDEGLRVGAQSALAYRYGSIMEFLNKNESKLNVTFSFAGFVRDGRLLVPSVVHTPNQFMLDEKGEARTIRDSYTVQEEAKIVSVVPTWRDYLWQQYQKPEKPHSSMLPRTPVEVEAWKAALQQGWNAGIMQANSIYESRLNDLAMAVEGRHLYVTLEAKKMISPAALQVVANKVTFNGRTMNVGEVIYNIRQPSNYVPSEQWRPVWTR